MQETVMAMTVSVDGNIVVKKINGDLKSLNDEVGGHIELVRLFDGDVSMYINEEGKLKGLPHNVMASMIAFNSGLSRGDFIVGNAVFLGRGTPDGLETSIDPDFCVEVLSWVTKNHKDLQKLQDSMKIIFGQKS